MTIIAIWHYVADESEKEHILVAADTRISAPKKDAGGINVPGKYTSKSEYGAKILSFSITCNRMFEVNHRPIRESATYSFGFSYSGDVLPALNTFAVATSLLQNLNAVDPDLPPQIAEIDRLFQSIAINVCNDCLANTSREYGRFNYAIFCKQGDSFVTLRRSWKSDDVKVGFWSEPEIFDSALTPGYVVTMGSGAKRLDAALSRYGQAGNLAPAYELRKLVKDGDAKMSDVGGSISMARMDESGLQQLYVLEISGNRHPHFNGIPISSLPNDIFFDKSFNFGGFML